LTEEKKGPTYRCDPIDKTNTNCHLLERAIHTPIETFSYLTDFNILENKLLACKKFIEAFALNFVLVIKAPADRQSGSWSIVKRPAYNLSIN